MPDLSAKTLMKCIQDNIASGTIIYSDRWRAYKTKELIDLGKILHSEYRFVKYL